MRFNDVVPSQGLADIARHVMGCRLSRETRVANALGDVASNIYQALPHLGELRARAQGLAGGSLRTSNRPEIGA